MAAQAATVDGTADTQIEAPSVTAPVGDTRLLHLVAVNAEGEVTAPAGMTERFDAPSPNTSGTRDVIAQMSDATVAAGATGVRTATAATGVHIGIHLALRPAP